MASRLQEDKNKNAATVLAWLGKHLADAEFRPIDREVSSRDCNVSESLITRATITLRDREYLILEHPRITLTKRYKLNAQKLLSEVTPEQLAGWITAYNQATDSRTKENGQATPLFEPVKSVAGQNAVTSEPVVTKLWPHPEPVAEAAPALSPAQLLLKQAQQLVEAEEKRATEEAKPNADLLGMEDRLNAMEGKVNTLIGFFEQAAKMLRGALPVGPDAPAETPEEVAPPTTRALLVRLVNSYAAADRKSEHDTWKYLYGQFDMRTGFNAYAQTNGRVRDQSYLSVIEERGRIDALYSLAKKLLVLPELK